MSLRFKLHQLREMAGDPRYLPFMLQRRFKDPERREKMAAWVASRRPAKAWENSLNRGVSDELGRQGIAHLGSLLSASQLDEAREFLKSRPISDPYQPDTAPFLPMANQRPDKVHVAFHEATDVLAAPHLMALANRPELLAIAEAFLGCKPTIGYLTSWWSFAAHDGAQAAERFHRDVDDWKFLKLFVYLTDVGEGQGPHVYVRASGHSARLRTIRRFEDAEVVDAFGMNAIETITGKAGDAFFEDTQGLHRGLPVEQGHRQIYQAVYTQGALPYAPRRPIGSLNEACVSTGVDLDPYVNRLYLA